MNSVKNTSIKLITRTGLLGPKLATLLSLLNEPSANIWEMAVRDPSAREMAKRKRYSLKQGKEHPNWLLGIASDHSAFATLASVSELQDILRKFLVAWIQTGEVLIDKGPARRTSNVLNAHRNRLVLAWETTGVHDPKRRDLSEKDSEFMEFRGWLSRSTLIANPGGAKWGEPLYLTPVSVGRESPRKQAFEILQELFVGDSPERYQIGKCTECGVFFWRKSLSPAKHGLFCGPDCQNRRSSKDTRKAQRAELLERRLDSAAAAFAKSKLPREAKIPNNHNFKAQIRAAVNAGQRSNEEDIKPSWVSRHWRDIVKRAAQIRKDGRK
jgi:hypothetical protein